MPHRIKSLFLIVILCLFTLSGSLLYAAGNDNFHGSERTLLDAKQVVESATQITHATYPNCDEALVDGKTLWVYHADGTGECQDEEFTKVLTEKGKKNNQVLECYFLLPYNAVAVTELEVIKPDGTVIPVNVGENSQESIDSSQMEMNIYDPNSRVLRVNIPGLEVGDLIHSVIRDTILRPQMPGEYSARFLLEGSAYIRHLSLEIREPENRPLQHILIRNEIAGTTAYANHPGQAGTIVHQWDVKNVAPLTNEPAMPSENMVAQRLLVSTITDWRAVSRWYWELSKSHLEAVTPEMAEKVKFLTANASTEMDKMKALFYFVSRQIRYMGVTPEQDRPGFEPHDVRLTFEKKYGVCRDKAALLVSLLRMAGLDAYPVLTNVGDKLDPDAPSVAFNHAIAAVELKNGGEVLLDPTDENTLDLLPAAESNQSYLVCRPSGADLKTSAIVPAEQNMLKVKTIATLSNSGRLEAKAELSFDGINDNAFREMFVAMKPDEQRRFFEKALSSTMPGVRLTALRLMPENMLDIASPLRAEIAFTVNNMAAFGGNRAIVNLPWLTNSLGIVNYILRNAGLAQRQYPLETYVTCGLVEDIALKLPDNFSKIQSIPGINPIDDGYVSYQRHFDFRDHTLICSKELKLKVVEFTPQEYLKLKQTLQARDDDERKTPVFVATENPGAPLVATAAPNAPANVATDVRILADQKQLIVKDAHTAVLKVHYQKQILNYAGKKKEAELKIPYNPATEAVRLISAAVTSAAGKRLTVDPSEIHLMDAEWNASAKRYTGGKVLVVNLPGVEVGSTIAVEYEINLWGLPYLAGFEAFQLSDELDQKSFQILAPPDIQIRHRRSGPAHLVTAETKSGAENQEFLWKADQVSALPAENQLLPDWAFQAGAAYFIGDPAAYLNDLGQKMLERSKQSKKSAEVARLLIQHAKTKLEALQAIRDYLAKSVRFAGPSFTELPLGELSNADTTLADGYGHQADRAILCYAMLKAAGFQPQFILASVLPPVDRISKVARSFPLPDEFAAPLVRVKVGKQNYYFNDTDEYARLGTTPHDGMLAIELPEIKYQTIRAANDCHNETNETYSLSLANDGNTRIRIQRQYYGTLFGERKRFFAELTPDKKKQYFQEAVSAVSQGARPVGELMTDFNVYPGIEQFTVEVDRYAVVDNRFLYFSLPFATRLFSVTDTQRTLPLFIPQGRTKKIQVAIELPPAFQQVDIAPLQENLHEPDGAGTIRITTKKTGGKYLISYQLHSHPAIISPADYSTAQGIESILENPMARVLLLESVAPESSPGK